MTGSSIGLAALFLASVTPAPEPARTEPAGGANAVAEAHAPRTHRPSGGRDLCLVCHAGFAEELEGTSIHGPVADDRCTDCHNPHASRHGSLLRRAGAPLCLKCHTGIAEETHRPVVHGALRDERECLACHVPHSGDHGSLLNQATDSLCTTCHLAVQEKLEMDQPHGPAAVGECVLCHVPHGSERASLLTGTIPALCWQCHEAGPALEEKHRGFALADADCRSCHDPHGASGEHIVRGRVHPPFEQGSCDFCHASPREPGALNEEVPGLCIFCHGQMDPEVPSRVDHVVNAEVRCTACHSPHAGEAPGMMKASQRPTCLGCHVDIRAGIEGGVSRHPVEVEGGRCTICHRPHEAAGEPLLVRSRTGLCVQCHQDHSRFAHPMGANVPDPRNPDQVVTCVSCHDPHSSSQRMLLRADPGSALCVGCHSP